MMLRKDSERYVYEVCRTYEDCNEIYKDVKFKPNDLVDVFDHESKIWISGRYIGSNIFQTKGTNCVINEIVNEGKTKTFKVESKDLAPYLMKVFPSTEVINIPMYNKFIKEDGTITYLEFPKMISLSNWCTCKQVIEEIKLQARHFMIRHDFKNLNINKKISASLDITLLPSNNSTPVFPFKITLIDTNTNQCAICSSKELEGHFALKVNCPGCPIPDENIPIKFIVKYFGCIVIHLDWKDIKQYELQEETEAHSTKLLADNKTTIYDCLNLFTKKVNMKIILGIIGRI